MRKKNLIFKLITIFFILMVIVISAMLVIMIINNKQKENEINNISNNLLSNSTIENIVYDADNHEIILDADIRKISEEGTIITIEECINEYYNSIRENNTQKIIDLLNDTYKQNNNITVANVLENTNILSQGFTKIRIKQIYYKEIDIDKSEYYVWADLLWANYSGMNSVYIIVNLDTTNNTYSITPVNVNINNESEYIEVIKQTTTQNKNSIIKNTNNELNQIKMLTPEIISYYLNDYITMAIYYPEISYNLLDEEYRENKFSSLDEYKQYIAKNLKRIENASLVSYGYEEKDGYMQYTAIDSNNNTYIIKRINAMEYRVICDIYTLDLFAEKYDNGSTQEKVIMNIQKIVEALNNKDYTYVYSKLTEEFKTSNYPTLQQFENIMSNTLYGSYTVSVNNYIEENNNYICDISFNGTSVSSGNVNIQIIMKLKEDRDFGITFEIKEAF